MAKPCTTTHCKIPWTCVSRPARKTLRKRLGVHTVFSTLQVRRLLWAKKWLRGETYPEEERTGAGEAMRAMLFGRLSFEKGQTPPSRFVRQSLVDLDALRRVVHKAEEGDRAVEDARTAAGMLWELIFHLRTPQETRSGGNGCLRYLRRIFASCFRELTSGQGYRVRSSHVRNVGRESVVKEAPKYISSSGVGKALTMRRQRHIYKPEQGHRDLSESRNGRARIAKQNSPLDQTAPLMSAHRVATELHMCRHMHQQTSESIVSDHTCVGTGTDK